MPPNHTVMSYRSRHSISALQKIVPTQLPTVIKKLFNLRMRYKLLAYI